MKGKIAFTFKERGSNCTVSKQVVRVKDARPDVLVRTLSGLVKSITKSQKDAEKFVAAVYCMVAGKMPPSLELAFNGNETEDDTDE